MGSLCSEMSEEDHQNNLVNGEMASQKRKDGKIKKLLLLGSGGSGKSTFFKQLQTIHGNGFSEKDHISFRNHVYHQVVEQMKRIIDCSQEYSLESPEEFGECKMSEETLDVARRFMLFRDDAPVTEDVANQVALLWADEGARRTFDKRAKFGITDSSAHFFDKIQEIGELNYIPTTNDVLLCRHRTTGVVDKMFNINGTDIRVFDVGGQKAERKKWIHCFEHVKGVIFTASLSGYDEVMYELETENVMHDSLKLFGDVCNNHWFKDTDIILFLNKTDLFEDKIEQVPITVCWPEYNGRQTYAESLLFIQEQFLLRNEQEDKEVYMHPTCATDAGNVTKVFNDVQQIIVQDSLDQFIM